MRLLEPLIVKALAFREEIPMAFSSLIFIQGSQGGYTICKVVAVRVVGAHANRDNDLILAL